MFATSRPRGAKTAVSDPPEPGQNEIAGTACDYSLAVAAATSTQLTTC